MDSLRIAVLVKSLPMHRPGGQENHAWALARGLGAAGHRLTIITSAHPQGESESHVDGIRIVHLPGTRSGQNSWALFRHIAQWTRAFDGEFDVFHSQGFAAMRASPRITPLVTTVHGTVWSETPLARQVRHMLPWTEQIGALWRYKARTLMAPLVHRQWARSTHLICDSDFTRRELLRRWPAWESRIDTVPLAVDLPTVLPERDANLAGRPIRLLSVGRLERAKGLEDLLVAMHHWAPPGRYHLTIVGDGPHRRAIEAMVRHFHLEDSVTITGRIDDDALAACWKQADLFVNPEWSQPAFGLVSLEALGWGLPVLGTQTGATPEIVTAEVGRLFPPGRPEELGRALSDLAHEPDRILLLRSKARARAEEFPLAAMIQGTETALQRAIGTRAGI